MDILEPGNVEGVLYIEPSISLHISYIQNPPSSFLGSTAHPWPCTSFGYTLYFCSDYLPPCITLTCQVPWHRDGHARSATQSEPKGNSERCMHVPGGARRNQGEPRGRSQEEPGGARRNQEEPGGARRSQEEPGGARRGQEGLGGARRSREEL